MDLISKKELKKALNMSEERNSLLIDLAYKKLKIKDINELYSRHKNKTTIEFINNVLYDLQIDLEINNEDLNRIPNKGGFIVLSNHPLGALDGLIVCKTILSKREDFKLMANFLLERIEPLKEIIFPINPFENLKDKKSNLLGVKKALNYVEEGNSLGVFPS